jgi:hypothetical protein
MVPLRSDASTELTADLLTAIRVATSLALSPLATRTSVSQPVSGGVGQESSTAHRR